MKKLIACALLGLGLTQSLVACSDDDDGGDNTAGMGGAAAGSDTGGKGGGGSGQGGSTAGTGMGGSAGSAGKGGGGSGGSGGSAQGGDGSAGEPTSLGGDNAGGSDGGGGDGAIGGDGAGGAGGAPPEEPVQTPTPRWLEKYCDAKASDTLGCEGSPLWYDCFSGLYGFLSGEGGDASGVCENDDEEFTKTVAMFSAMDALAAACPKPKTEDWRCNAEGLPEPLIKACRDAEAARVDAYKVCFP